MCRILKSVAWFISFRIRRARALRNSKEYKLIKNPGERFECLSHVKDETWDTMYTPELFELCKERTLVAKFPAIDIYRVPGGMINQDSDIVLVGDSAWWDKYNEEDFVTLAQPADANLVSFNTESVRVLPCKEKVFIKGRVLNVTGQYSTVWSHFLFQFVCKMYFAGEAGLLNEDITILTNDYQDENINTIYDMYLSKFPHAKRMRISSNVDYQCEELICMRATSYNYDDALVFWDYRMVFPQLVIDTVYKYVRNPLIEKMKNNPPKSKRYKKLFLARYSNRLLKNNEEVESYFREQGFHFVEGWELSLEEKVDLFYHAEIIVGIHSSAWLNLIFCNKVKCLQFLNNRFTTDMVAYTMTKPFISDWLDVCGMDDSSDRRSDYYIPLEKIKAAYKQLIESE